MATIPNEGAQGVEPRQHHEMPRLDASIKHSHIHDPILKQRYLEFEARERIVQGRYLNLVAEELAQCYMHNGVNHKEACRDLALEYIALVKSIPDRRHHFFPAPKRDVANPNFDQNPAAKYDQ